VDPQQRRLDADIEDVLFYTTGCQLLLVVPPAALPNAAKKSLSLAFSALSGEFLGERKLSLAAGAVAYDARGGQLWGYAAPQGVLHVWANAGPEQADMDWLARDAAPAAAQAPSALGSSRQALGAGEAGVALVARVLAPMRYLARTRAAQPEPPTFQPFGVDRRATEGLLDLLASAAAGLAGALSGGAVQAAQEQGAATPTASLMAQLCRFAEEADASELERRAEEEGTRHWLGLCVSTFRLLEAQLRAAGADWLDGPGGACAARLRELLLSVGRALRAVDRRLPRWIWGVRDRSPLRSAARAADRVLVARATLLFSPAQLAAAVEEAIRSDPSARGGLVCQLAASRQCSALLDDLAALRRVMLAALEAAEAHVLRLLDTSGAPMARPQGRMCGPLQLLVRLQGQLLAVCASLGGAADQRRRDGPRGADATIDVLHVYANALLLASARVVDRAARRITE
jgi:hypothetical protein